MENTKSKTSVGEQCSYYETVKSKQNIVMTLAEFVTAIRSDRWRQPVENYRKLMQEDRKSDAKSIKDRMPGLVVAGVCEGGHSKANFRSFSGCMMVDIDHYEGDVDLLLDRFRQMPWFKAGWVSISGKGVKIVVRIEATTLEEYEKQAYPIVSRTISRLFDLPVDLQCKDLSRVCYASYDPHAFYQEECEVFPWREELESLEQEKQSSAPGLVSGFLDRFLQRYPFVPNYRHQFLLALGRYARTSGMNELELEQLIKHASDRLSMPDCDAVEIRRNITDSYRFMHHKQASEKTGSTFKGQKGHLVYPNDPSQQEEQDEENREHNRVLRLSAPCFPDWIFDRLPPLFQKGLQVAKNPRQRDMLLLSMMTNLSACLPNVRMLYDDTYIYPHLFLAVIASSASGKGIMTQAARLAQPIQKMLKEDNDRKQQEYDEAQAIWEQERHRAMKEKRKPDFNLRPEQPSLQSLIIPADTSRPRLIQLLSTSPHGLLMNVSEMDTLRSAVRAEYGKFDDLMRACFHHEMFGTDFKSDGKSYMVYNPKLAFCASGTPSQFHKLCPSIENGAYSRYLIYLGEQEVVFRSMAPGGERTNKNRLFHELGEEVLQMYRYLKAHPTDVCLTPDQWDWHLAYFGQALQGVRMEESDGPVSVVLRHGLNTARLAMILTAIRKYDAQWEFYDMKCTDEDFGLAMAIMEVLLNHSLMLSTSLSKEDSSPTLMKDYFKVRKALEKLKPEFHYKELIEALMSEGYSESGARRCRKRLLSMQIIEQKEDKYCFTTRQWRGLLAKKGSVSCTR